MSSNTLTTLPLPEQLPASLADDAQMQALATALDARLRALPATLARSIMLADIATVPETILDLLAWHLRTPGYARTDTVAQKRALVAQSIALHRRRGTPAAIDDAVAAVFGDGMTLQEWFEYGGEPYTFRVIGDNEFATPEQQARLAALIAATKNARSHLSGVIFTTDIPQTTYHGTAVHCGVHLRIGG